jgi:hypothetical protein
MMRLKRIRRHAWDVLAAMDSEGRTVLDELYELGGGYDKLRRAAESRQQGEPVRLTKTEKLVERMLVHLYETAPEAGPDNMGGNVKSLGPDQAHGITAIGS